MNFALVLLAAVASGGDGAAALADRATLPPDRQPFVQYVTTATATPEHRPELERALRFVVASTSRQVIIERCLPVPVPGSSTLYRLDLLDLGWPVHEWQKVLATYPYNPAGGLALIVRADWLVVTLTDEREADAYYPLVFGRRPKTRDEALAILGVDKKNVGLQFGLNEGQSSVAVNLERRITNFPILRGYAWGTEDFLKLDARRDPLNALLPGEAEPDGEEWIVGIPKLHLASGTRGALQVYFLANAQGQIVDVAPVTLVEDWTEYRGIREICNAGSCIQCHGDGINSTTKNQVRAVIESGVDLRAQYPNHDQISAFHLADVAVEIARNNQDYAAAVRYACDCLPNAATSAFVAAVKAYDAPVTLEACAREMYVAPEEIPLALGWARSNRINLGPRAPMLAHGEPMPRDAFEEIYRNFRAAVDRWRAAAPNN